ncbi:MAG TPA: methyl-accepting chemotaxis protein [Gammaproteobacteria bacterium]|nr:methyl-accepting chemotaxis protein [Gammaproteobacteria bacterium]
MNKLLSFGGLRIGARLLLLIAVQGVVLLGIGVIALLMQINSSNTGDQVSAKVEGSSNLVQLAETFRNDVMDEIYKVNQGTTTWDDARNLVSRGERDFRAAWTNYISGLSTEDIELVYDVIQPYFADLNEMFSELKPILESQDRSRLNLFVSNDLPALTDPFLDAIVASTALDQIESNALLAESHIAHQQFLKITVAALLGGLIIAMLLGVATYYSIAAPVRQVSDTVQKVSQGELTARTGMKEGDELATLGAEFDKMLDERVANLAKVQEENERLNNSVMGLLQAVYKLSQRDLTARVPVTEDVTGPVADSLNLLTDETAKVLKGVLNISVGVAKVSEEVKLRSDNVISAATLEQQEVEKTAAELAAASDSMIRIAKLAQACNDAADKAIKSTESAHGTVSDTVNGINAIRNTIRETEKRIKRLGERSQEISGAVNLINSIAERTHILALNASMHAASAGEAGRGFAVVADEVQRLAENARNATNEIASLVNNIQVETNDTVTTMNDAISQVVEGSRLAERAGTEMQSTQQSTAELVAMVQQIAKRSVQQARASNELRTRAQGIQKSSRETNAKLKEQTKYTDNLVRYSEKLLQAVNVFTLPEQVAKRNERTGTHSREGISVFPEKKVAAINA